jgi:hypothetical protein
MASVLGKHGSRVERIVRMGRCLRGWVDGKAIFRFTEEEPRRVRVARRPGLTRVEEGWFARDLLEE